MRPQDGAAERRRKARPAERWERQVEAVADAAPISTRIRRKPREAKPREFSATCPHHPDRVLDFAPLRPYLRGHNRYERALRAADRPLRPEVHARQRDAPSGAFGFGGFARRGMAWQM